MVAADSKSQEEGDPGLSPEHDAEKCEAVLGQLHALVPLHSDFERLQACRARLSSPFEV